MALRELKTDVLVIGAGPGGYYTGIRLGQMGIDTIVVEQERVGGVCLNHGCIPSKALIHASRAYESTISSAKMGITVDGVNVDWITMRGWKDGVVLKLTDGVSRLLKANGAQLIQGKARFMGTGSEGSVEVEVLHSGEGEGGKGGEGGAGEDTTIITANKVVVATGANATELPFMPFSHPRVLSSRSLLAIDHIPERLLVVGGGFIGLELGTVFSRLGSKVTVIEAADRILGNVPVECSRLVVKGLREKKIDLLTGARVKEMVDMGADGIALQVETEGGMREVQGDYVMVAVGLRPNTRGLGLETVGVEVGKGGFIITDSGLQTTRAGVYAIGDVRGGMLLAHKAYMEAELVCDIIGGKERSLDDVAAIPWVVFTEPEVIGVGITEDEAIKAGVARVKVGKFPLAASGRALTRDETDGYFKVFADGDTDMILGIYGVGMDISELSGEMALAIETGCTAADMGAVVHVHPTLSEAIQDACHAVHGRAIHIMNRSESQRPSGQSAGGRTEKR